LGDAGERSPEQPPDNVLEVQALMQQIHGVLQPPRIEPPPLRVANAASIHQRGWTAGR
jgi:hypothetical protein